MKKKIMLPEKEGVDYFFGIIANIKKGPHGFFAVIDFDGKYSDIFSEKDNVTASVERPTWLNDDEEAVEGMGVVIWKVGRRRQGWRAGCICKHTPNWRKECLRILQKRRQK